MEILHLKEKDVKEIVALDETCFGEGYDIPPISEEKVRKILENGFILGINAGKKLASDVQVIEKDNSEWYVNDLATHPENRGQGLANLLVKEVVEKAKEKKVKLITTTVQPKNLKSQKVFLKNGFMESEFLPNHFGKGKHRVLLVWENK